MRSENINELFAALALAQSEMTHAQKDSKNPHLNSKYADLASVWAAIRVPITKNGLSVIQLPDGDVLETILGHKSGQYISVRTPIKSTKADVQGYGSGLTYARRYALASIVGIAQDDDDGNLAVTPEKKVPPRNQPPATATAKEATDAMANARNNSVTPREANESDRPAFDDYIRSAVLSIGAEPMLDVCQSHGYDDPSQVLPKDFRSVMKALKELMPKQ